jgi:hypothetical protein
LSIYSNKNKSGLRATVAEVNAHLKKIEEVAKKK